MRDDLLLVWGAVRVLMARGRRGAWSSLRGDLPLGGTGRELDEVVFPRGAVPLSNPAGGEVRWLKGRALVGRRWTGHRGAGERCTGRSSSGKGGGVESRSGVFFGWRAESRGGVCLICWEEGSKMERWRAQGKDRTRQDKTRQDREAWQFLYRLLREQGAEGIKRRRRGRR